MKWININKVDTEGVINKRYTYRNKRGGASFRIFG